MEKHLKKLVKPELINLIMILCKNEENFKTILNLQMAEIKQLMKTQNP